MKITQHTAPKRQTVLLLLVTAISAMMPNLATAEPTGNTGLNVSCQLKTETSPGLKDQSTTFPSVSLTASASEAGGRYLLMQKNQLELWVKTHATMSRDNNVSILQFSAVVIDKNNKLMTDAASSSRNATNPRQTTLTLHSLDDRFQIAGRLELYCLEVE